MSKFWVAALVVLCATVVFAKGKPLYKAEDCGKYTVQFEMNQCANGNADTADAALNALYKQVMQSRADDASRNALKQSERAWIKHRDKTCDDEVGSREDSGSIWPMEMSSCLQKQTDARLHVLHAMLACTAGVSVCNPH
jgi:uncharacterized protein YecT (DUF1311 family)